MKSFKKSAFTLIELLVVIAIIAILASILFPVFGRARENARRSSCTSNLKQIGLGAMQYVQDYDEKYPLSDQGSWLVQTPSGADGIRYGTWMYSLYPYIKSTQIFKCPSGTKNTSDTFEYHPIGTTAAGPAFPGLYNYGANENVIRTDGNSLAMAALQSSSLIPMIADCTGTVFPDKYRLAAANYSAGSWSGVDPNQVVPNDARHLGGSNIAFADGHVKFMQQGAIMAPTFTVALQ